MTVNIVSLVEFVCEPWLSLSNSRDLQEDPKQDDPILQKCEFFTITFIARRLLPFVDPGFVVVHPALYVTKSPFSTVTVPICPSLSPRFMKPLAPTFIL